MSARTANMAAPQLSARTLHERLSDTLMPVLRGAWAVADDAAWSVWGWYQVRRSVRVLSALDDHMLKDIGVSRDSIMSVSMGRIADEQAIRRFGER